MSEIPRLIRIAARRNLAAEYTVVRFRALRSLVDAFRRRTAEERISGNVVLEAFLRGYLGSHPAALSMVDQWVRESGSDQTERSTPRMNRRDMDEIHAAARSGMVSEEE